MEAASMARRQKTTKGYKPKTILLFPDLDHSKNAVVNSLAAASSQESYGHAIDEFIGWYCSEPRLAFNRTVVIRYRFFLEQKNLAPATINVRLGSAEARLRSLRHRHIELRTRSRYPPGQRGKALGRQDRQLVDDRPSQDLARSLIGGSRPGKA